MFLLKRSTKSGSSDDYYESKDLWPDVVADVLICDQFLNKTKVRSVVNSNFTFKMNLVKHSKHNLH